MSAAADGRDGAAVAMEQSSMLFCPADGNLLLLAEKTDAVAAYHFYCSLCPFKWVPKTTLKSETRFEAKKVDDVLGGDNAWKYAPMIDAPCTRCGAKEVAT